MLLELARTLLEQTTAGVSHPIPVIFNLTNIITRYLRQIHSRYLERTHQSGSISLFSKDGLLSPLDEGEIAQYASNECPDI